MRERAVLVTFHWKDTAESAEDAAHELHELAKAARLETAKQYIFSLREPNATYFIGKGRAEEIAKAVEETESNVVVIDEDLSATQQRNLEEILQVKTIDRTQLILDIFALRARSNEGKLQVELAQLKYLLPRLGGEGIYLSRLGGGVGTRGPGEQKLEVDRRRMRERITKLADELKDLQKRRQQAIEKKKEKEWPLISLVGYTNAGKSTLFNRLTSANVVEKNQLFSTLDTTTRMVVLPGNQKALFVDTVGFVKRLPHHLVESFKATLEESLHADLLLHVTDASRPDRKESQKAVEEVLAFLQIPKEKVLMVYNKVDLLPASEQDRLREAETHYEACWVSAKTGQGFEAMLQKITDHLPAERREWHFFIPKEAHQLVHWLYENGEVLRRHDEASGTRLAVVLSDKSGRQFEKHLSRLTAK